MLLPQTEGFVTLSFKGPAMMVSTQETQLCLIKYRVSYGRSIDNSDRQNQERLSATKPRYFYVPRDGRGGVVFDDSSNIEHNAGPHCDAGGQPCFQSHGLKPQMCLS